MKANQSFLIIQTAFLGDVILATALVEKVKEMYPDAEIDFLLRKGNEAILEKHPHIRELIIFDKRKKYKNLLQLIFKIRKSKYDYVLNLQRFATSGLLTIFSGGGQTIGFDKNPLSFLFSKKVTHLMNGMHEAFRNQLLIPDQLKGNFLLPKLYPNESDYQKIESFKKQAFITISPASVWQTKQWPKHKWIELIKKIPAGLKIFLLGGPGDFDLCKEISLSFSKESVEILAGRLSLLQSAALMKFAQMNFVNDSAPMHLASGMNAPVTAIFCSTVPEFGFGPLSDDSKIIEVKNLNCRPCGLHGHRSCPKGHFKCAEDIEISSLLPVS